MDRSWALMMDIIVHEMGWKRAAKYFALEAWTSICVLTSFTRRLNEHICYHRRKHCDCACWPWGRVHANHVRLSILPQYPTFFEANQFCHNMHFSSQLFDIYTSAQVCLACVGSWLNRELEWGGGVAVCWTTFICTDHIFVRIYEEFVNNHRMSVIIDRYVHLFDSNNIDTPGFAPDMDHC